MSRQINCPHTHEMRVANLRSININGISARTLVKMLADFIRRHILPFYLYKKWPARTLQINGYITYLNIGTAMRGTALLARNGSHLTNIDTKPS
jgi:hypothetical protein